MMRITDLKILNVTGVSNLSQRQELGQFRLRVFTKPLPELLPGADDIAVHRGQLGPELFSLKQDVCERAPGSLGAYVPDRSLDVAE
jgi:hypothetical protein